MLEQYLGRRLVHRKSSNCMVFDILSECNNIHLQSQGQAGLCVPADRLPPCPPELLHLSRTHHVNAYLYEGIELLW